MTYLIMIAIPADALQLPGGGQPALAWEAETWHRRQRRPGTDLDR
jgi:hypothetical protein